MEPKKSIGNLIVPEIDQRSEKSNLRSPRTLFFLAPTSYLLFVASSRFSSDCWQEGPAIPAGLAQPMLAMVD